VELRTAKPSTQLITNYESEALKAINFRDLGFKKARDDERVEVIVSVNLLR